jgi:hypothetical protein
MITIDEGLKYSLKILKYLRKNKNIKKIPIYIGTFTNCREQGLTFRVSLNNSCDAFTWCVYQHRNSDDIIINGKEGFITMNGDLPYSGDSSHTYLASFRYDKFEECANKLAKMIITFWKTDK